MDFDEAIAVHSYWKMTLASYLRKPNGSVKPSEVEADDACELGEWIIGEGASFSRFPEFSVLKEQHSRFHKAAAEVVRRADAGQSVRGDVTIGSQSEFGRASDAIVQAIMGLKNASSQ